MLFTIAQKGVLIVIEAPTKVINLFLRELEQREKAYARVAATHTGLLDKLSRANATSGPSYAKPGAVPGQSNTAASVPDTLPPMPACDSPLLANARILSVVEVC